jgi:CRISPR-associated endoribonuclease Cas6
VRLLIRLRATADARYNNAAHHKLRGRLWKGLDRSEFDKLHDGGHPPGLCNSQIFPWGEIETGDQRHVLVAAANRDILGAVADGLVADREFNVGEMQFRIEEVVPLSPDVGEPGSTGTIETGTGVLVRIPPWRQEEYGIADESDGESLFWRPEYSTEPFQTQLMNNLDRKHNRFQPDYLPGPSDTDGELFEEYKLLKTYALPLTVSEGEQREVVLSKWRFGYHVRDDDHRRHLNLALDTGIGERNALGLGFLNIEDKTLPTGETA